MPPMGLHSNRLNATPDPYSRRRILRRLPQHVRYVWRPLSMETRYGLCRACTASTSIASTSGSETSQTVLCAYSPYSSRKTSRPKCLRLNKKTGRGRCEPWRFSKPVCLYDESAAANGVSFGNTGIEEVSLQRATPRQFIQLDVGAYRYIIPAGSERFRSIARTAHNIYTSIHRRAMCVTDDA